MFEEAVRFKIRFDTIKGSLSVEDLWDLPLTTANGGLSLDNLARELSRKLKDTETESFVVKPAKADEVLQLKFSIIKHVIDVLLAEKDAAKNAAENREKKRRILDIIAQKQDEKLASASLEELTAMADSL
jgi:hypothetical protein